MASATTLNQCDMYRLAVKAGIPANYIPQMVCTAKYESSWNPQAVNHNTDGSTDRGLWQVNNRYWCSDPNFPGKSNGCGVDCSQMLLELPNALCAARILHQQGLNAWYGYKSHVSICNAYKIDPNCTAPAPGPSLQPSPLPSVIPPPSTTTGGGPSGNQTTAAPPTSGGGTTTGGHGTTTNNPPTTNPTTNNPPTTTGNPPSPTTGNPPTTNPPSPTTNNPPSPPTTNPPTTNPPTTNPPTTNPPTTNPPSPTTGGPTTNPPSPTTGGPTTNPPSPTTGGTTGAPTPGPTGGTTTAVAADAPATLRRSRKLDIEGRRM